MKFWEVQRPFNAREPAEGDLRVVPRKIAPESGDETREMLERCLRFEQLQLWNDWASRLPLTQLAALFSRCSCFTDCFVWNGTLLSTVSRISESVNPFRADRFLCHTANWVNSDQYEILYY